MAVTVTATPAIGGGFGNHKIMLFELSGTYATNGIPKATLGFDASEATVFINGVFAQWDATNAKLKLGTIGTTTVSTTTTTAFTELANDTNLGTLGITKGIAIF